MISVASKLILFCYISGMLGCAGLPHRSGQSVVVGQQAFSSTEVKALVGVTCVFYVVDITSTKEAQIDYGMNGTIYLPVRGPECACNEAGIALRSSDPSDWRVSTWAPITKVISHDINASRRSVQFRVDENDVVLILPRAIDDTFLKDSEICRYVKAHRPAGDSFWLPTLDTERVPGGQNERASAPL